MDICLFLIFLVTFFKKDLLFVKPEANQNSRYTSHLFGNYQNVFLEAG